MLRRSHSKTADALLPQEIPTRSITMRPKRHTEFVNTSEVSQQKAVDVLFQTNYGYHGRPQQNESAVHLLHGRTVFLLAGTGFGKSRVPEVFYLAHDHKAYAPIVLCINPLDSLGDDQVRISLIDLVFCMFGAYITASLGLQVSEKLLVKLNSVNLNGPNCTQEICDRILQGDYAFVYVVILLYHDRPCVYSARVIS